MGDTYTTPQKTWLVSPEHANDSPEQLAVGFLTEFGEARGGHALQRQRARVQETQRADEAVQQTGIARIANWKLPDHTNTNIIESDDVLVVGDTHAPHHDAEFVNRLLDLSVAWGIKRALINGDLFDHAYFKTHPGRATDPSFREELRAVREIVGVFAQVFETVTIDMGNHEERWLLRQLNSALDVEDWALLFTQVPNVKVVDYPFVFIHGRRNYVAIHPGMYRKDPAKVAIELQKEKFPNYNVITHHTHHVGMARRRTTVGTFDCFDAGCCARPETFEWLQKSATATPNMNQGALVIKDSRGYLVTPDADWDALTRMYQPATEEAAAA